MKWLFIALLIANLLVFGYTHLSEPPAQDWHQREVHAERAKLLAEAPKPADADKAPTTPSTEDKAAATEATSAPVAEAGTPTNTTQQCLRWESIPLPDLARAKQLLDTLQIGKPIGNPRIESKKRFWVYMLPQPSLSDAHRKTEELQALGLSEQDFFIVNDAGRWRNAISLGVYSTLEAAKQRLDVVQEKGVKSARVGVRETLRFASLIIPQGDEATGSRLAGISADIKGSEVNLADCPP
ncbi:hypothetical protein HNQ59_001568 [Chitinivorax tropicus]|uniref:SPOR domain-containing protein n=1 Tax=Chitinivorax tropicus TaxID=714531 RepID=A0A840MIP6_9PROT|nr:hypothetical protein [Chitinivorax tropicus]MBB5018280.1 hypothetical protein [Chitinivorax tropicus]